MHIAFLPSSRRMALATASLLWATACGSEGGGHGEQASPITSDEAGQGMATADASQDASNAQDAGPTQARPEGGAGLDAEAAPPEPVAPAWKAVGDFGPGPRPNPFAAPAARASQHGDTGASDSSPLAGPGTSRVVTHHLGLLAACPTVLISDDGLPLAVCTQISNRVPIALLLDAEAQQVLAERELSAGQLFGGVYPYLDHQGQLVVTDGHPNLLRIAPRRNGGTWTFEEVSRVSLRRAALDHCGGLDACDGVVGLSPDYEGRVWFATGGGIVGFVDPTDDSVHHTSLPEGERIANSIATAESGTAVVSDHALYLWGVEDGEPVVRFRKDYGRGEARKPGQLSHGSGSSPTFFGPGTGADYVALTDNATPMHLRVYRSDGQGTPVCNLELPLPAGYGSENSPIGSGRSVIVAGTYGYPYPALPEGAEESVPASADLGGGMVRVDVAAGGDGCEVVWTNTLISAAVPQLSVADGLVYTMARQPLVGSAPGPLDGYAFTVIDGASGETLQRHAIPGLSDTLQLSGTLAPGEVFFQGTITGVLRVEAAAP